MSARGYAVLERELAAVERREAALERRCAGRSPGWKTALERRVPPKAADGLKAAFSKAFALLFEGGAAWVERGCRPEELAALYSVRDAAVERQAGRAELRRLCGGARRANALNTALTALEGLVLGALGIGLPDILLFLGMLLRGIYATAMNYGFDCSSRGERFIILKLMQASLSSGDERRRLGAEIDALMLNVREPDAAEFGAQLESTASAFALDMLAVKFVQGMPLIGVIGGAANPLYYRRMTSFAELKYKKRYLLGKMEKRPGGAGAARGRIRR